MRTRRFFAFLVVFLCWRVLPSAPQDLLFNGILFEDGDGLVLLSPGRLNTLDLALSKEGLALGQRTVAWCLTSPEGRAEPGETRLDAEIPQVRIVLGPLCAPPVYEFEAGDVFLKGYRLDIRVFDEDGFPVRSWSFYQDHGTQPSDQQQGMGEVDPPAQRIRLVSGLNERIVYNPRFGSLGPLSLRLGPAVLAEQNDLELHARLNEGEVPEELPCVLRILAPDETVLWQTPVTLERGADWTVFRPEPARWPAGTYQVELLPVVEGRVWNDGPRVRYRRTPKTATTLFLSPVAPWTLERDERRQDVQIRDFRAECERGAAAEELWRWVESAGGGVGVAGHGDFRAPPLVLRPEARGYYAVFAAYENAGGFMQVGGDGLVRGVAPSRLAREVFVEAADLTDTEIRVFPSRDPAATLVSLRLVPVTAASAQALAETLAHPPLPLLSVNDWAEYFGGGWSRLLPDQFAAIVGGLAEFGFRSVGWSVGRSWVEYPSKLPDAKVFPCVPYEEAKQTPGYPADSYDYGPRITMMNEYDPLGEAYGAAKRCGARVWPWLAMQRHYSESFYGGMFTSPFYRRHPEWRQVSKDGKSSGLSFYYPEVRRERVDILVETAELGAAGVLLGCDRQVPMLRYEPPMVEEFRARTGIDALKIDVADGPDYLAWLRFRANFFTETLRELRTRLDDLGARQGRHIPVGARIPSGGLLLNLAQGLDVETWCREGLVDLIDLDPLELAPGEGRHDVRPYLALGHRHGIPVMGGIGSTAFRDLTAFGLETWSYSVLTAGLKRARGLHRAGVDGISTWETEILTWTDPARFTVALYGHPERLDAFLEQSNLDAVYPVDARNAAAGHDNHSVWRPGWTWSMAGDGGRSF